MRQEVAHLVHEVDPQLLVLDADMDMHAADEQTVGHGLHVVGEPLIALLVHIVLLPPIAEGVRRCCDRSEAVIAARPGDTAAQAAQFLPNLADVGANARADFHLGLKKLVGDLLPEFPDAFVDQAFGRIRRQVTRLHIDQEVFLLDTQCEGRFGYHHGPSIRR